MKGNVSNNIVSTMRKINDDRIKLVKRPYIPIYTAKFNYVDCSDVVVVVRFFFQ